MFQPRVKHVPTAAPRRQLSSPPNDGRPAALNREAACAPADLSLVVEREEACHGSSVKLRPDTPCLHGLVCLVCVLLGFQDGVWTTLVRSGGPCVSRLGLQ